MQHDWSGQVLDILQGFYQQRQVMTVDRAKVSKAELLKQHSRHENVLDRVLQPLDGIANSVTPLEASGQFPYFFAELVELLVGHYGSKIF